MSTGYLITSLLILLGGLLFIIGTILAIVGTVQQKKAPAVGGLVACLIGLAMVIVFFFVFMKKGMKDVRYKLAEGVGEVGRGLKEWVAEQPAYVSDSVPEQVFEEVFERYAVPEEIVLINGVKVVSKGNDFFYLKYVADSSFVMSFFDKTIADEALTQYEYRTVSWERMDNYISINVDTFPGMLSFWNPESIEKPKGRERVFEDEVHSFVFDSGSDTVFHLLRPAWKGELFFFRSSKVRELQEMLPEDERDEVPYSFYGDFGERDWYRYPLRYPHEMTAVDMQDNAFAVGLADIKALNFDANWFLAKTGDQFVVVRFDDQDEKYTFDSSKKMFAKARKLGYKGETTLMTVREYGESF